MIVITIFSLMYLLKPVANFMGLPYKNAENYGPYEMMQVYSEQCRGPKSTNLTKLTCDLRKQDDSSIKANVHFDFTNVAKFEEMKLTVYTIKNDKKIMLWNNKITEPCQHYALGVILTTHLQTTNCWVKKGLYVFEMNITDITQKFFGDSFFYGEYIFKIIAFSKKGNIGCMIFHEIFAKK